MAPESVVDPSPMAAWEIGFLDALNAWTLVEKPTLPVGWLGAFDDAAAARDSLAEAGRWFSGPASLLGVARLRHLEQVHSTILAWLLDPTARHGLGTRLSAKVLGPMPDGSPRPGLSRLRVSTEVPCSASGDRFGFVDIVVRGDGWTILIENKLWSGQHGDQLDLYYDAFRAEAPEYIFLTPYGSAARSRRAEVRMAWRSLSWRHDVIPALDAAVTDATNANSSERVPGRAAVIDYVNALPGGADHVIDAIDDPKLRFYLERRELIDEWSRLADLEPVAAHQFLLSVEPDLDILARDLGPDVLVFSADLDGEWTMGLYRSEWTGVEYPRLLVGLGWTTKRVRFAGRDQRFPWLGLRVRKSGEHRATYERIRSMVATLQLDPSLDHRPPRTTGTWMAWRWAPCSHPNYWEDLSVYRQELVTGVAAAWADFATLQCDPT